MTRKFLGFLLVVLLVLGVAPLTTRAQDKVTITISTWAGVDEAAELQGLLDEINANNDEYEIVHQPIPADYYTTVKTQLAAPGTGADMYWMDQNNMALASEGVFMSLNDCLADAEPGTAGDLNDYYPGILAVNEFDGEVYGLPWIAQPVIVYYNKALFDAAGLEYPTSDWTWDTFTELAKALTLDTDGDGEVDQWGFTNNSWPPPYIFVWQAGGELINEDFSEAPIDSPEFVEGFEFYLSTAYNPEMSPSREVIAEQGFGEMFKAGKIAMFMGGAADDLDRVEGLDVGVVRVPGHPVTGSHTTFAWNASTVINANTEHPEEACKALVALTDAIHHWKIVSPRISQATVEHLVASEPRKEASAEVIIEAAQDMRALPIFGNYAEFDSVFWSEFWGPLINDETDLSVQELAAEVRFDLEDTLP
ncbi:MAG: ABC transporter substrate-binding protein [Chloroflexota bacterium]|nr:sugar ABC transporter substrate-binding protein [Chloroflexota bacterium]NOG63976.1 sugar ABC transporter substrate-binding protein [Chloroflexota bacterium]GIK65720.1 MAG: ABC transporter substrate-binding protein [Chloroflexota bacterium]